MSAAPLSATGIPAAPRSSEPSSAMTSYPHLRPKKASAPPPAALSVQFTGDRNAGAAQDIGLFGQLCVILTH